MFQAPDPARVSGAAVTFEPGARTAWHTHPLGQTLIITAGYGHVQRWGEPIEEIRPGDVAWFPPGRTLARRLADNRDDAHRRAGKLDGKNVDWMEKVTDEQYATDSRQEKR